MHCSICPVGTAPPHHKPSCNTLPFTVRALQGRCLSTGTRASRLVTKLQPADKAATAVGTFNIFSTPRTRHVRGTGGGDTTHTHTQSCAHPPNSPFPSCDLERLKSSTGQSDDVCWGRYLGHKGEALSIFEFKKMDTTRATAGKECFHHEFNVLNLVIEKDNLSFP